MTARSGDSDLAPLLLRSDALDAEIIRLLDPETYRTFDNSERTTASFAATNVSLEHARGLRTLLRVALPTPGVSLMRLQYEALTRSVWLLYAASDADVGKLQAPLSATAEKTASRTPSLADMLTAIVGKAPSPATQMLAQFKDVSAGALNSFVHGGIHPLRRQYEGYPIPLLMDVARSSNGLLTMTGMMLAILTGNQQTARGIRGIQASFADCLPAPLPHVDE